MAGVKSELVNPYALFRIGKCIFLKSYFNYLSYQYGSRDPRQEESLFIVILPTQHIRLSPETVCHHLNHCHCYCVVLLTDSSKLPSCHLVKFAKYSKSMNYFSRYSLTQWNDLLLPMSSPNMSRCACAPGWAKGLDKGWDPYYAHLCLRADDWTQLLQRLIFSCPFHTKNSLLAINCLH